MKCVICKNGDTQFGQATVTLQREKTIVVIKDVPADVCDTFGEYYLSEAVTEQVLKQAEQAAARGAEVEIASFAA